MAQQSFHSNISQQYIHNTVARTWKRIRKRASYPCFLEQILIIYYILSMVSMVIVSTLLLVFSK